MKEQDISCGRDRYATRINQLLTRQSAIITCQMMTYYRHSGQDE